MPPQPAATRRRSAAGRVVALLAVGGLGVAVIAATFAVVASGLLDRALAALPFDELPDDVALAALEQRSVVLAADGTELAVLAEEFDREPIELERVPEHVRRAIIAAEDRSFLRHDGYDAAGIGRALLANFRAGTIQQGGSTITQQLAKQNFVGSDRTLARKLEELRYAIALEDALTKDELLERYLNQIYFGGGAYGIAAASEELFRVAPEDLSVAQGALLAGVIRAPSTLDPRENADGARQRRDQVLLAMAEEGYLSRDQARVLSAEPLDVQPPLRREQREPYVVEAIKREFLADDAFGEDEQTRRTLLYNGGLEIHSTIDPGLQALAEQAVTEHTADLVGPSAAIASVEPGSGRVLALYSGADFAVEQFDLATQGRRPPGSAFKPYVLAAALEDGYPLSLPLEGNSPAYFPDVRGWDVEDDGVVNFGGTSMGAVGMREALVRSSNTAFADLILRVGTDRPVEIARLTGIDMEAAMSPQDGPAIALGALGAGVTPLEMAASYATFAAEGHMSPPHLIERVVDRAGNEVSQHRPEPQRVFSADVNAAVLSILSDAVRSGTGRRAQLVDWPVAGKTGTTQDSADAWFVGTTPVLSTSVWLGHPEGQVRMPGMTGGGVPASLWRAFMEPALAELEPRAFPDADRDFSALLTGEDRPIPDVRSMDRDAALAALTRAGFVAVLRDEASSAPAGTVRWQRPGAGSSAPVGSDVVIGVSTGTPPPPPPPPAPEPTQEPAPARTEEATPEPGPEPTEEPSPEPTEEPSPQPSPEPTEEPTPEPTEEPTPEPTGEPSPEPTGEPSPEPTGEPSPTAAPPDG